MKYTLLHMPNTDQTSISDYTQGIQQGNRAMLARAITLIESSKPEHQKQAQELLQNLLPLTGKAYRIGVTGVPGVGKSTTIDQLGVNLIANGHKIAVLAVDPTSSRTGGSILGDKTRMARLSQSEQAFIRPSPTSGELGGVTRKTRETILLCEAAGYDIIIVETVGVGQSETTVADMVDFFLVLMLPGAGDDLQGLKKGILEIADMIAVNKADGDNITRAKAAASDYFSALHILTLKDSDWVPPVLTISGLHNIGLDTLWDHIREHQNILNATGALTQKRQDQSIRWMHQMLEDELTRRLRSDPQIVSFIKTLEAHIRDNILTPPQAVREILNLFNKNKI